MGHNKNKRKYLSDHRKNRQYPIALRIYWKNRSTYRKKDENEDNLSSQNVLNENLNETALLRNEGPQCSSEKTAIQPLCDITPSVESTKNIAENSNTPENYLDSDSTIHLTELETSTAESLGVAPLCCSPNKCTANHKENEFEYICTSPRGKKRKNENQECSRVTPAHAICGRRIVDIRYLIDNLKKVHAPFMCGIGNMTLQCEVQVGMKSCFIFVCDMCQLKQKVWTEDPDMDETMDINTATAAGILTSGMGYTQFTEFAGSINMPVMTSATYYKYLEYVTEGITETALKEMEEAAAEEYRLAVEAGDVCSDGIPFITVISDGSWLTRSYGKNYRSLLGAAFIIGLRTGKILFVGARSKYCMICHRARVQNVEARVHNCIRNWDWDQSSSSMEQDIIVEGFRLSIHEDTVHKLRYKKLIADGDSSVMKNLLIANPYPGHSIEKVDCRNHLYRNFCNKMRDIASTTASGPLKLRKAIEHSVIRIRAMIANAVANRKKTHESIYRQAELLRGDISNAPKHVFGDHTECSKYCGDLCKGSKPGEENLMPELIKTGLYSKISKVLSRLIINSKSLIIDVDNSTVEMANSIAAKMLGGKRILYSTTYFTRLLTVVININTRGEVQRTLHKTMCNDISPGFHTKKLEQNRIKKNRPEKKSTKPRRNLFHSDAPNNPDYGDNSHTPPLVGEELKVACDEFLDSLKMTPNEIVDFERASLAQYLCDAWIERRRGMLTASNFAEICKMLTSTLCDSFINKKLYTDISNQEAIIYGTVHENDAICELQKLLKITIKPAGLFVDIIFNFLGATPDGLCDEDTIIEVKCPYSAQKLSPDEAVRQKKVTFWKVKKDGTLEVNTNDKWYYQVQGALHITQKKRCIFAIWTPVAPYIKYTVIERDDDFWESKMKDQLVTFYMECLLPELADPMRKRKLPIRNPQHRIDANKALQERRQRNKDNKMMHDANNCTAIVP